MRQNRIENPVVAIRIVEPVAETCRRYVPETNLAAARHPDGGQGTEFDAIQGPRPYRMAYLENVKKFLEKVDVE